MKKSKKALLWTIVPVLGVSSGVAGAVAGVTNQKTSVDTNNVATSSSATTMTTRNASTSSGLEIKSQTRNLIGYSGLEPQKNISVQVSGAQKFSVLKYNWEVNKGTRWEQFASTTERSVISVSVPEGVTSMINWTFRCTVTETKVGSSSVVSEDIKFTIVPKQGRYISVSEQPEMKKVVEDGQEVTLKTEAKAIGIYSEKEIGYQWFEYDSNNDKFTLIDEANTNTYSFVAKYIEGNTTKKYVCRYYFKDGSTINYLNESNQSIVTTNKGEKEEITVEELKASSEKINVGDSTTLSVVAKSTKTDKLEYQWYKVGADGSFEEIKGADTAAYKYTATKDDANKKLIFSVMIKGTKQYGFQNYLQSGNLEVEVGSSSEVAGNISNEVLASVLDVSSSVTTNQASVRSNFYLNRGITSPEYTVTVKGVGGLSYQWYYVGRNGRETLIEGANTNVLKPSADLLRKVYNDNSSHRVDIVCKISKGDTVIRTIDKKTNSRFYLGVVINNRRVSNL